MRSSLIAFAGAAVLTGSAGADIIINQLPTDKSNGLVSQETAGFVARSADDFTTPLGNGGPWNITRLKGVLFTNEPIQPGSGKFEVYADSGGNGPANQAPLFTLNADAAQLVGNNFGLNLVEFSVGNGVNTLFTVNANTRYWLSTVGTGTGTFQYFATFNYGGPVNGQQSYWKGAAWGQNNWGPTNTQFGVQSDFAMYVEGFQVPGPASAGLLGLGALAAGRRRR